MRSLEEVLAELKAAEKEYAEKCEKYGIAQNSKKKKEVVEDDSKDATEEESNDEG